MIRKLEIVIGIVNDIIFRNERGTGTEDQGDRNIYTGLPLMRISLCARLNENLPKNVRFKVTSKNSTYEED